jgi:hypothetical protein
MFKKLKSSTSQQLILIENKSVYEMVNAIEKHNDREICKTKESIMKEIDNLKDKIKRAKNLLNNAILLENENIEIYETNKNRLQNNLLDEKNENIKENFELIYKHKMNKLCKYKDALKQKLACYENKLTSLYKLLSRNNFNINEVNDSDEDVRVDFDDEKQTIKSDTNISDDNFGDDIVKLVDEGLNEKIDKILVEFKKDLVETIMLENENSLMIVFKKQQDFVKSEIRSLFDQHIMSVKLNENRAKMNFDSLFDNFKNFDYKKFIDKNYWLKLSMSSDLRKYFGVFLVSILSLYFVYYVYKSFGSTDKVEKRDFNKYFISNNDKKNNDFIFDNFKEKLEYFVYYIYHFVMNDGLD